MSRSKEVIRFLAFSAWALWAFAAVYLLASYGARISFIALYLFYLVFGGAVLLVNRRDILAPPGLFSLAGFLAFGLSLVFIYVGPRTIPTSGYASLVLSDEGLFKALVVFLVAKAAFILGSYSTMHRHIPMRWVGNVPPNARKVSLAIYMALVAVVVIAAIIRLELHLGEAGAQTSIDYAGNAPVIPYVGILNYALFDCVLVACMWFLAQGLRQSRLYVFLGLSLLLMIATTQALLGWRGGIIRVTYVAVGLFWYQTQYRQLRRPHALGWLLILVLSASAIIQLGNAIRVARRGGAVEFASSFAELITKIAYRSQGTTRLAAVMDHFGSLSLFNDFFLRDLITKGLSAVQYVDRTLYGVVPGQLHSVGASGPGSAYISMGLFGVASVYLLLGIFFKSVYSGIMRMNNGRNNILYIVLYAHLMFGLANVLSENFDLGSVKNLVAVLATILFLRYFISRHRPATREKFELAERPGIAINPHEKGDLANHR